MLIRSQARVSLRPYLSQYAMLQFARLDSTRLSTAGASCRANCHASRYARAGSAVIPGRLRGARPV